MSRINPGRNIAREREIARLLKDGKRITEIARLLKLSHQRVSQIAARLRKEAEAR